MRLRKTATHSQLKDRNCSVRGHSGQQKSDQLKHLKVSGIASVLIPADRKIKARWEDSCEK